MIKRSLNYRFGLVFLVLLAVVGPGTYALHRYQVQRNAEFLKDRSTLAETENDVPKAITFLDRYLALRPTDNDARVRYAELIAKSAKTDVQKEQALLAIERAIRDGANTPALRRRAGDLALEIRRTSAARKHFLELLKTSPKDAGIIIQLGRCEENDVQPAKAAEQYEQAVRLDPHQVEAYTRLAKMYRAVTKPDDADNAIERMVANNPDSPEAHLYRSNYLRAEKRFDPDAILVATKDVAFVREKFPTHSDAILASSQLALARGIRNPATLDAERETARKELKIGRELHPDDIQFSLAEADLELQSGRKETAGNALAQAEQLAIKSKSIEELWYVANQYVTVGKVVEAERVLTKLNGTGILPFLIEYIEARIAMTRSKWNDAVMRLERVRKEKDFVRMTEYALNADLCLAQCYANLGNHDKRLESLIRALKIAPGTLDIRLAEADARMALGQVEEALGLYITLADQSVGARFNAVSISLTQANSRTNKKIDWTPVQKLLNDTPAGAKSSAEYGLLSTELLLAQNRVSDARKVLETARDTQPSLPVFWLSLAELGLRENDLTKAETSLAEAEKKFGDRVDIRLLKGRIALARDGNSAIKFVQSLELKMDGFSTPDQNRLLLGLSGLYGRLSAMDETRRVLSELARRLPEDLGVQLQLLDALAEKDDQKAIESLVDQIRRQEGEDGAAWRYADAVRQHLLAIKGNNPTAEAAARTRLAEVRSRRPDWERVAVLEGIIEDSQQHVDKAIDAYLRAIQLKSHSPRIVRRAVELLTSRRRFDEAAQILADMRDTQTQPEVSRVAAILNLNRNEPADQTIALAIGAVDKDSKDPRDQIWLGQIYSAVKKPVEAEAAFRKAIALNAASAAPRTALVLLLASLGKLPEAKAEIDAAKGLVAPTERDAFLATCYQAVGDRAEAARHFTTLAESAPNDPTVQKERVLFHLRGGELPAAEAILHVMIEKAPSNDPWLAAWPRRTLALSTAATGDYRRGSEALKLVEENLRLRSDSVEDQRVKALILASRPGARRQSIKSLEDMFVRIRPTPDEEFLLARLYEADGDWTKARDMYRALIGKRGGDNPRYTVQLVRSLIQRNELNEAAPLFTRLEPTDGTPVPAQVVELKARLLHKQGNSADANALLKSFVERTYKTDNNPRVLLGVGLLMSELGLTSNAEALIKQYVAVVEPKDPASPLTLAEFLAKQNRVVDALEVCSSALSKKADPEFVARACVAVVRLGNPTEADFTKAAALIDQAFRLRPASTDIPVSRADLLDAQAKYDEAIAEYRAILSRQPANLLAANNLAWLLVLRGKESQEALERINGAIAAAGPTVNLLDTLGVIYLKIGRTEDAIQTLTTAIEQAPEPYIYFHLAQAQDKAKRVDEAKRSTRRAKELQLNEKDLHALEREEWRRLVATVPDV